MASTYLDEIFVPLAADLLGDLGKSITFTAVSADSYDTATGVAAPINRSSRTVKAVVADVKGREVVAGLVQSGDKKVSIPGASFSTPPKPTDEVTVDGAAFTVNAVEAVYSGEQVALYVLTCRRL